MSDFNWLYILLFTRFALLLVFASSAITKLNNLSAFQNTIDNFHILPKQLDKPSAYLLFGGEIVVALFMLIGNYYLMIGFLLTILLLTLFCMAILWVLQKGILTSCGCFGPSQKEISYADFWRDIGFLVCALLGLTAISIHPNTTVTISYGEKGILGAMAIVFVVLSFYLGEIIELFRYEPKRR
jgi:hypothetical protein